ncbi:solute carrier family 17 member 9-like isoform X2 [Echeneis naucrates]|nr:solute carrier family 17 member 9-like isoform X2 [Echeneis naucrates]
MLFISTCLLYCARMAMPICAITMATTFHWSKIESGLVLGGFLWGYCFTQILGGHASDKIGGERVLFISVASWALITAGTPFLVQLGSHTLALMTMARFLMGLLQGVFFPSLASLCSQRVVEGERGFIMSTMNSGSHLGTLLAAGLGSMILDCCGWESVFYGIGILTALWALVVWKVFLKGKVTPKKLDTSNKLKWSSMDWLRLFKKAPVCAMVFAHMCVCSTSYTLLSWLPTYFEESFPHSTVWVYNVVPWLTAIPSALVGGYIADFLINHGYGIASVRKIMQFFAMGVSSLFLILLSGGAFTSFTSAVVFISFSLGVSTFTSSGVSVNVQDLAPSCAGALYGFMNTLGAFMGLVLVSLSGYLIEVTMSWNSVFSLITIVNTTGLVIFLLFGDAGRVDLENSRLTVCDT